MLRYRVVIGIIILSTALFAVEGRMDERPTRPDRRVASEKVTPLELNYQGYLASSTDTVGVTGSYDMSFRLYTVAEGGTPVWSENHADVQVDKGVFNVYLGELNPIPANLFGGQPLWLEIQVGTETLSPRKKIVSVGYSIRSQFADSAIAASNSYKLEGSSLTDLDTRWVNEGQANSITSAMITDGTISRADVAANFKAPYCDTADYAIAAISDNDWQVVGNNMYSIPTGKVGIGTTSPTPIAKLHVNAGGTGYALLAEGGSSYSIRALWGGSSLGAAILAKNTGTGGDALQVIADGTGRSGIYAWGSSGIDYAIRADASGATWAGYFTGKLYTSDKIGIGTTNPTAELHIKSNAPGIKFEESDQGNKMWAIWGSNSGLMFSEAGVANRLYIKEGGNVGIGTTSPGSHRLYVKSSGSGVGGATAYIENTHANGLAMIVEATSSDLPLLVSQKGDGPIFRCDSWTGGWHPVFKVENDGTTECAVLRITGGSDLSEQFDIKPTQEEVKPGMVVCIDPEHPGELIVSTKAYDHKVAGIISGAGGIKTGMLMGQIGSKADGSYPVALTGRVYCWADATYGAIKPGDLLTTSDTPGHAMKVTDYSKAQGAIIGKAMSSLEEGKGLVLVLVTLQ